MVLINYRCEYNDLIALASSYTSRIDTLRLNFRVNCNRACNEDSTSGWNKCNTYANCNYMCHSFLLGKHRCGVGQNTWYSTQTCISLYGQKKIREYDTPDKVEIRLFEVRIRGVALYMYVPHFTKFQQDSLSFSI